MRAIHAFRLVAATLEHADGVLVFLLARRRHRRLFVEHVAPFVAEVNKRSNVGFPRLNGEVIHVIVTRLVVIVFVGKTRKAMPELVDDDVAAEAVAARTGAIKVVYATTAVFLRVDEDINLVVGHLSRQVTDVAVVGAHAVTLAVEGPEAETHGRVLIDMVARHGAATLLGGHHHATHVEALAIAVVRRIIEQALHEEVAILDELAHLRLGVAFGQDDDVDSFRVVLVANPCVVNWQMEVVIVADEIVVGVDGEAHPLHQLAFPSLA